MHKESSTKSLTHSLGRHSDSGSSLKTYSFLREKLLMNQHNWHLVQMEILVSVVASSTSRVTVISFQTKYLIYEKEKKFKHNHIFLRYIL